MKNAIIFDHDGTLVDSIEAIVICTIAVLEQNGFQAPSLKEVKRGMALPTAQRLAFHSATEYSEIHEKMCREFYQEMHKQGLKYLHLYDGVRETLMLLASAGFALGMVTNNEGVFVRKAASKLSYAFDFEVILGEENIPRPKPYPDGLLQACAGMGVLPENCWYVGDGKPDFDAARAAGMKCALVSWGAHPRKELEQYGADKIFDSPYELSSFFVALL